MKTASFVGVILPQTPVHLVQILNSIFQWGDFNPGTFTFNPNSMNISIWTTNVANQSNNDLDWPGFTCFVAKTYQSRIMRFWGKILNSNFCLCKNFDISQLCLFLQFIQTIGAIAVFVFALVSDVCHSRPWWNNMDLAFRGTIASIAVGSFLIAQLSQPVIPGRPQSKAN